MVRAALTRAGLVLSLGVGLRASAAGEHLRIDAPPTLHTASASPPLTVCWVDGTGAPVNTASALSVTLTSSSATGQFSPVDDGNVGWVGVYSTQIPAGASTSPVFYYRDGVLGAPILEADGGTSAASAQVQLDDIVLSDDVESGTLFRDDSPAGAWTTAWLPAPLNTLTATSAAAHRGTFGIRLDDRTPDAGSGPQGDVTEQLAPLAGNLYARTWIRISPTVAAGDMEVMNVQMFSPTTLLQSVHVSFDRGGLVYSGGNDVAQTYTTDSNGALLTSGTWHLLEVSLEGLGTSSGLRRLFLDGSLISSRAVDWSGSFVAGKLTVGEFGTQDRSFTGTIDYDDVRAAVVPLASLLSVSAPARIVQGECAPIQIGLVDSVARAAATAPYDALVGVDIAVGGANLFANPDCTGVTSSATIASGRTGQTVYLQPLVRGDLRVRATQIDFLEGLSPTITVTGPPVGVGFPAPPVAAAPGRCSPPVALGLFDDAGTPVILTRPFAFSVDASVPLYPDPACAAAVDGGIPLAPGASMADVYFLAPDAGTVTISAGGMGVTGASQAERVQGGSARIDPAAQTVALGTQVTLDASGTQTSGASTPTHFHWREVEGPTGIAVADAPIQTFTATVPGDYRFQVVVEDSLGGFSDPASASVHVEGALPAPPSIGGCSVAGPGASGLLAALALWLARRRRRA